MAHAIRLLVATPNAPSNAQDKWDNWRTDLETLWNDTKNNY